MKRFFGSAIAIVFIALATSVSAEGDTFAEKTVGLLENLANIVDQDKADCAKMAKDINHFVDQNATVIREIEAHGKTLTPAQKEDIKRKYAERLKAALMKLMGGMQKCNDDKAVMAAMARFKPGIN